MASDPKKNYDVGFAKPPTHSRFKPGQSGNPKGRPKGGKNEEISLLAKIAKERIVVTLNGRTEKITKREAALLQLMNKAASGDQAAIKLVEELFAKDGMRKAKDIKSEPVVNIIIDRADADL